MAHPYADRAKTGQEMAKARYADGGAIDNSIDVSEPGPTQYPYGLADKMTHQRGVDDLKEAGEGTRFYDNGSRIPGQQKAKNDAYMSKRK